MRFRRSQDWFELFRKIRRYIYEVPKVPKFPKVLRFKKVFFKKSLSKLYEVPNVPRLGSAV